MVSDGIEQGIARILSRNYVTLLPILANRLRQVDQNSWRIDFPYSSDACRAASGNCKCKSTPRNKRVLVIGDGKSDMCVASTADFVFAKGSLAEYCERQQHPSRALRHLRRSACVAGPTASGHRRQRHLLQLL